MFIKDTHIQFECVSTACTRFFAHYLPPLLLSLPGEQEINEALNIILSRPHLGKYIGGDKPRRESGEKTRERS